MQIIEQGVHLSDAERQAYLDALCAKYPDRIFDKVFIFADEDTVSLKCEYHYPRSLARMSGCYIGDPTRWNDAKQAELRDTLPNPIGRHID